MDNCCSSLEVLYSTKDEYFFFFFLKLCNIGVSTNERMQKYSVNMTFKFVCCKEMEIETINHLFGTIELALGAQQHYSYPFDIKITREINCK